MAYTVNILRKVARGSKNEAWVDVYDGDALIIGGYIYNYAGKLSDREIADKASAAIEKMLSGPDDKIREELEEVSNKLMDVSNADNIEQTDRDTLISIIDAIQNIKSKIDQPTHIVGQRQRTI